jgi:hypothetical protein
MCVYIYNTYMHTHTCCILGTCSSTSGFWLMTYIRFTMYIHCTEISAICTSVCLWIAFRTLLKLGWLFNSPNSVSTLRGSYGRCERPGLDQGAPSGLRDKSSLARCPCAFRLRSPAQSAWLACFTSTPCSSLAYVHFSWQAWYFRNILRSKTSFRVTCAGHRTLFSSAWQAWHFLHVANEIVLEVIFDGRRSIW